MLFNSVFFIILFLPGVFFLYFYGAKKHTKAPQCIIVIASFVFFGWWNWVYVPILAGTILFNYFIGHRLRSVPRLSVVVLGIIANLSVLGFYKYYDFFIENTNSLFNTSFNLLHVALPLGISFFTFQQITYLVDSYKQKVPPHDLLNYATFVSFFPQLISGPIVHHSEMMPQFARAENQTKNYRNIARGMFIFAIGFFKKTILADTLAHYANNGFANINLLSTLESWLVSLSYTFQLYFDFSGYIDMAIGIALLFNIKLPVNFNSPYRAHNIQQFWHTWHITLGRFFREYVYIPLGGSRVPQYKLYRNILIVAVLSGLWHGASWTFVVWGTIHGCALVLHRFWHKNLHPPISRVVQRNAVLSGIGTGIAWFLTFNFVNIGWVLFRAHTLNDAVALLKKMGSLPHLISDIFMALQQIITPDHITLITRYNGKNTILIVIAMAVAFFAKNSNYFLDHYHKYVRMVFYFSILMIYALIVQFVRIDAPEFLYFNF